MLIYERAKNEAKIIENKIKLLKTEYNNFPNGRLECHRRKDSWRWFVVKDNKRQLLRKEDDNIARRLAYKRVIKNEIDTLDGQLKALKKFIEQANPNKILTPAAIRSSKNDEINRLAREYKNAKNIKLNNWMKEAEDDKSFGTIEPTVPTKFGWLVKSKSEAFIANELFDHNLYVRYEPTIFLNDPYSGIVRRKRPDFAIWSEKIDAPIYWEHLGMMDKTEYLEDNAKKIELYILNGLIPMENLILTSEREENRIDIQMIETLIEYFFE